VLSYPPGLFPPITTGSPCGHIFPKNRRKFGGGVFISLYLYKPWRPDSFSPQTGNRSCLDKPVLSEPLILRPAFAEAASRRQASSGRTASRRAQHERLCPFNDGLISKGLTLYQISFARYRLHLLPHTPDLFPR
jgi:hypothetical protein